MHAVAMPIPSGKNSRPNKAVKKEKKENEKSGAGKKRKKEKNPAPPKKLSHLLP